MVLQFCCIILFMYIASLRAFKSCDSCQLQCLLAVVACYLALLRMFYDFYLNIVEHLWKRDD